LIFETLIHTAASARWIAVGFGYEEPFQRFSFVVWAKAVETAAWVVQRPPITGLKPRCE